MARLLETFDVFLADGASVIRSSGVKMERITGVDLMETLCAHGEELGLRVFLYGSTKEHNEQARQALQQRFPSLQIVGGCDGYQDADVIEQINCSSANIVFVAKGTPAQERWIAAHKQEVRANVFLGSRRSAGYLERRLAQSTTVDPASGTGVAVSDGAGTKALRTASSAHPLSAACMERKKERQVREHGITEERN